MCISRRALKGWKYLFRDIHNFSFSAKIQDDIFPLGTEYCCTTLWVKNSLEIAVCYNFEDIFNIYFLLKIQDSRQKWRKLNFFSFCIVLMYYPVGQKFTQNRSISYSCRDIKTFSFSTKIKVAITQLAMDLQVSKFAITQYIKK